MDESAVMSVYTTPGVDAKNQDMLDQDDEDKKDLEEAGVERREV